ncbi:hypothetical protein Ae331Ps2_6358c [Pseudonocardia sp. Ae331_Ps2]|nr:hypothetical protein Ae331Ps2_6358c [Pseudonocardia sp. Ae331_Ps2]
MSVIACSVKNSMASSTLRSSTSLMFSPRRVYSSTSGVNRLPAQTSHVVIIASMKARSV